MKIFLTIFHACVLSVPVTCLTGSALPALDLHVVGGGNDSNPGTADKGVRTLQHALDELARRRAANDASFDPSHYQPIIDAAGPEPPYRIPFQN